MPIGLCSRIVTRCACWVLATVSISITASAAARWPSTATSPLTRTQPASIQASASRREARPRSVISLAMRGVSALDGGAGRSTIARLDHGPITRPAPGRTARPARCGTAPGRSSWCCGACRPRPARSAWATARDRRAGGRVPGGISVSRLPCTTSTGTRSLRDAVGGLEALRDQRADRQPAPLEAAEDIGDRREAAFDDQAARVVDLAGQVHRDRAAERVAEDVARALRVLRGQPVPGGARVLVGEGPRTAAPWCSGRSRGSRCPAPKSRVRAGAACGARCRARPSVRRAGTAAPAHRARAWATHRPCRRTGSPLSLGAEVDPHVLHALGRRQSAPPGAIAGLEDPLALLLVQRGAAGQRQRGEQGGGQGTPAMAAQAGDGGHRCHRRAWWHRRPIDADAVKSCP